MCRVVANPRKHLRYLRILRQARAMGLADTDRLTELKYAGDYLSSSLTMHTRRRCLRFHYQVLIRAMRHYSNSAIWQGETEIWAKRTEGGDLLRLTLSRSILAPMEGESELCFTMNGQMLSTLTFSLVHGRHLTLPCAEAIFIGGLQGGYDCRQPIRDAAKLNGEVSPAAMLLLAVEALANVLGIDHMVGTSTDEQASASYALREIMLNYDGLWQGLGARSVRNGFYVKAVATLDHADRAVAGSHPSRTRRRRVLKRAIREAIEQRMILLLGARLGNRASSGRIMGGMPAATSAERSGLSWAL